MSQQQISRFSHLAGGLYGGLAAVAACVLVLNGCGGGGGGSAPANQTGYASGRISGFGSVVVNGVHYDESSARIQDEDGVSKSSNDLKLGMVVTVESDKPTSNNNSMTATAQDITVLSLVRGPVESVTPKLVVLGQTITVNASTVKDDSLVGGLAQGQILNIYGLLDSSGAVATRIELSHSSSYSLLGLITAQDTTAKTLTIGTAVIDVSAVTLPQGIALGSLVRVKLHTTQVNGAWVAISVKSGAPHPSESEHAEVEGMITEFTSTKSFSVDGLPVDASIAAFTEGTTGLAKGAHVEVEGTMMNGVLMATEVDVESDSALASHDFEVRGAITAVDTMHSTIVVHNITVSYAGGTVTFVGGTATDLQVGVKVEVRGTLAADGKTLNATQITFKH